MTHEPSTEPTARDRAEAAYDALSDRVETRVQDALNRLPPEMKPKLRGWLHLGAIPAAALLCLALLVVADDTAARAAVAVYTATSLLLFSVSAIYHRGTWQPGMAGFLRRLDHANIFLIIAGTYTPYAVLLLPADRARLLLTLVWSGAALGVLFREAPAADARPRASHAATVEPRWHTCVGRRADQFLFGRDFPCWPGSRSCGICWSPGVLSAAGQTRAPAPGLRRRWC